MTIARKLVEAVALMAAAATIIVTVNIAARIIPNPGLERAKSIWHETACAPGMPR